MRVPTPLVLIDPDIPEDWLPEFTHVELRRGTLAMNPPWAPEVVGALTTLNQRIGSAELQRWPGLVVISNVAVGLDNLDLVACKARGVSVGHTPGVLTDATADLTMALMLALARHLVGSAADAKAGRWQRWSITGWLGGELAGRRLGIVGLGAIGRAVARRAEAFGMSVCYCGRPDDHADSSAANATRINATEDRAPSLTGGVPLRLSLDEVLARSDIVSLHCPLTAATRELINDARLATMKPTALLINTARGGVVDQHALVRALSSRTIAGAALDVTTPEPLPPEHPLFALHNCLITPHIGSATVETRQRMTRLACANLIAGLEGTAMPHPAPL